MQKKGRGTEEVPKWHIQKKNPRRPPKRRAVEVMEPQTPKMLLKETKISTANDFAKCLSTKHVFEKCFLTTFSFFFETQLEGMLVLANYTSITVI